MATAKNEPTTGIYQGTLGGSVYANKIPVTTALPSLMVFKTGSFRNSKINTSVITAVMQLKIIT